MNWRRIFGVKAVRVSMMAAVLFALLLIKAGTFLDIKEKEPEIETAIASTGAHLEAVQKRPPKNECPHIIYFFPKEEKEKEPGAEKDLRGNSVVIKQKRYDDGRLSMEAEYDKEGNVKYISYNEM